MNDLQRIRDDLKRFAETGELPPAWEPECPGHESTNGPAGISVYCDGTCQISDAEFDRRVDEINREIEAIESGCFEPCPIGCPRPCCRPASREP